MTEQMRREMVLAISVAKARGVEYKNATEEQKRTCHRIARAALPGANTLITNAEVNARQEMHDKVVETHRSASRKAYDDGFEDGQCNHYQNRWVTAEEEQVFALEEGDLHASGS